MSYDVVPSPEFKKIVRKFKRQSELLKAMNKKIERLSADPYAVGGFLTGELHGLHATRLIGIYRLIFRIKEDSKIVELVTIDHRGHAYG